MTTPVAATPMQAEANRKAAMTLWRDDNLARHPKGSCSGCHGADFIDLATVGSTDADIRRRAKADGATAEEVEALAAAVQQLRTDLRLPANDARNFRPFQPGGKVLMAELSDAPAVSSVKRDIAFANQLNALLPTLMGAPLTSLQQARQARDELLDLAQGTNAAGANPQRLNLRRLPIGITYPRWAADVFHGAEEGSFNDWVADIAHDAQPALRNEWLALQDRYLANPNNETFWTMYLAAGKMTQSPKLGTCAAQGTNAHLACEAVVNFSRAKFLSALIGQHMMRVAALGKSDAFFSDGALAFSALDQAPELAFMRSRGGLERLPADPWEVADTGRTMLGALSTQGSFVAELQTLGFPDFAQSSIDPARSAATEQHSLRLPWFWIGFTLDPSLSRIASSKATTVGEYMVATLMQERLFVHNAFVQNMRLAVRGSLPVANAVYLTRPDRVEYRTPAYQMDYAYFWAYGRTVLDNAWAESKTLTLPTTLKAEAEAAYARLTGNGFRMSMLLQIDALAGTALADKDRQQMPKWLDDVTTNGTVRAGGLTEMDRHFVRYHPQTLAADRQLMARLRAAVESKP